MDNEQMIIESRAVGPFMKNGFVLACKATQQAAYIDPGDEAPQLLEWIEQKQLKLVSIPLTHAHMDHITGVGEVKAEHDVPIYLHPDDAQLYEGLEQQGIMFGFPCQPAPPYDHDLKEGDKLQVGRLTLDVIHTPGHSPGHVCFVVGQHVFCGDAVFAGSIGRTDLPGGDYNTLINSIREKILPLGDEKILHPGHGPDTTVERERQTNPFLT
ncbi:MAG TPA: MBL fold metallo-hydrolase [Acidobacteriota bacterium]|nr:MBL fold metallo-hydrolase [Acidobacteriota bacterium]